MLLIGCVEPHPGPDTENAQAENSSCHVQSFYVTQIPLLSIRPDTSDIVRKKTKGLVPLKQMFTKEGKRAVFRHDKLHTPEGIFTFDLTSQTVEKIQQRQPQTQQWQDRSNGKELRGKQTYQQMGEQKPLNEGNGTWGGGRRSDDRTFRLPWHYTDSHGNKDRQDTPERSTGTPSPNGMDEEQSLDTQPHGQRLHGAGRGQRRATNGSPRQKVITVARGNNGTGKQRQGGTMARGNNGTGEQWHGGEQQENNDTGEQWHEGNNGMGEQWHGGTMARGNNGMGEQWHGVKKGTGGIAARGNNGTGGTVGEQWHGGTMAQGKNGTEEQ
ncbi:hypothetical protein ACOMHN_057703 [Nucella lapillus]